MSSSYSSSPSSSSASSSSSSSTPPELSSSPLSSGAEISNPIGESQSERFSPSPSTDINGDDTTLGNNIGGQERIPTGTETPENPKWLHLFHPNEKGTRKQKRCDYDSDESSEPKKKLSTMVDFDRLGDRVWGERLLFEVLSTSEVDALVGLANSNYIEAGPINQVTELFSSVADNSSSLPEDPKPFNPLLNPSLDAPLPPSHIGYIRSKALHRERKDSSLPNSKNWNSETSRSISLDDSAGVAIGMYLEEALTASLLPLAGLHVLRCRALEGMEAAEDGFGSLPESSFQNNLSSNSYGLRPTVRHPVTGEQIQLDMNNGIRWKDEKAVEEWTLPPEEAILKLMEQGLLSRKQDYQFVPRASRSLRAPTHLAEGGNSHILEAQRDDMGWSRGVGSSVLSSNPEISNIFVSEKRHE